MAGKSRYRIPRHMYSRADFVQDLAKALRCSREEAEKINICADLLVEDALWRCQAVETAFGVVRMESRANMSRVKVKLLPRRSLEEKLTLQAADLED
jgi:hypothetical protein